MPTIIDTDSFQVRDPYNNKVFRCLVGSEGFTPPELIGVDLKTVDQAEVHDRFRLGVVIYYLLFGGPPFRGAWQGTGQPPEQAELIQRGLWPFSPDRLILPSPTTMPLEIVHPRLQDCFLSCFNKGHQSPYQRPTAQDWLEALELALNDLVSCGKIDSHYYSLSYGHCYWCDRAKTLNLDIFPGQPAPLPPPQTPRSTQAKPGNTTTAPARLRTTPSQPGIRATSTNGQASSAATATKSTSGTIQKPSRRKFLVGLGVLGIGAVVARKSWLSFLNAGTPQVSSPKIKGLTEYTETLSGGVTLTMVTLPAGEFLMGSPPGAPGAGSDEFPQHEVRVSRFAIGKYPVTQAQWQAIMGNNPSRFKGKDRPVERVSWDDAHEFCKKLNQQTGKNYRLPTEAEWEYACRAGTQTSYYFGDDAGELGDYAWYGDNSDGKTHPVGGKRPNDWGLYDMSGNVWEWCEDRYHDSYANKPDYIKADGNIIWSSGNEPYRRLRGGSWSRVSGRCRSANRFRFYADDRINGLGFRLCLFPL